MKIGIKDKIHAIFMLDVLLDIFQAFGFIMFLRKNV